MQRARAAGIETPLAALVDSLLHPLIAAAMLAACVYACGAQFTGHYLLLAVLAFLLASQAFDESDVLAPRSASQPTRLIREIVAGWAIVAAVLLLLGYATGLAAHFEQRIVLAWLVLTPAALFIGTNIAQALARRAVDGGCNARAAVIVGADRLGRELAARLRRDPYSRTSVRGFFDDRALERLETLPCGELLGRVRDAPDFVRRNAVDCVYVALPIAAQPRIVGLIGALRDSTASVYFVPHLFAFDPIQARVEAIDGIPVVAVRETPIFGVNAVVKRVFDVVLASVLLLFAWPLFGAIALAVRLTSPGPAIFRQRRYGLGGEEFKVCKFRTMTVQEDGAQVEQARKDDRRLTPIGAFLRRTSLDELPQLFNVLAGSMSIVGPRPHAVAHNERYRKLIDGYMLRHKVKPGITGWAQVNGFRGETETVDKMRKRVEHDLAYLRNWSVSLDLQIVARTFVALWSGRNAY